MEQELENILLIHLIMRVIVRGISAEVKPVLEVKPGL
jgi:hypothetical protein